MSILLLMHTNSTGINNILHARTTGDSIISYYHNCKVDTKSGAVGTTSRLSPEVPGSIPGIITCLCDFLKSFDRVRAGQIRSRVGVGINSDSSLNTEFHG